MLMRSRATLQQLSARLYFSSETLNERIQRHGPQIFARAGPHGHQTSLQLLVAQDDLVRQLLQAMFSNFIGYFLITQIGGDPEAGCSEVARDFLGVAGLPVRYCQYDDLDRCQPKRERPGIVFDQDADESL